MCLFVYDKCNQFLSREQSGFIHQDEHHHALTLGTAHSSVLESTYRAQSTAMMRVMSSVGSPTEVSTMTIVTSPDCGIPAAPMLAAEAVMLQRGGGCSIQRSMFAWQSNLLLCGRTGLDLTSSTFLFPGAITNSPARSKVWQQAPRICAPLHLPGRDFFLKIAKYLQMYLIIS